MTRRDPRIDAYIAAAAPFARPILRELRRRVHAGCTGVVETIKWGMPAFEHHGPLAGMAAFKGHAVFGFWKHERIVRESALAKQAMGSFGRLGSVADLPSRARFLALVRHAARLNEQGVKVPRRKTVPRRPVRPPAAFQVALRKSPAARSGFAALSPSCRREYVQWIADAKRDETRDRRIRTAVAWLAKGRALNWKYECER